VIRKEGHFMKLILFVSGFARLAEAFGVARVMYREYIYSMKKEDKKQKATRRGGVKRN
jgi:hypothetical protein